MTLNSSSESLLRLISQCDVSSLRSTLNLFLNVELASRATIAS